MKKPSKKSKPSRPAATTQRSGGRSQSGLRAHNERQILSLIRRRGPLPKAEIAQATGLSSQAATVIINALETEGLLIKGEPSRGRVGQPSIPYSLNPDGAFAFGIKIGRRSFDLTLENLVGKVCGALHETCDYPTVEQMLNFLHRGIEFLQPTINKDYTTRIRGIGIATPFVIWQWAREMGVPENELLHWQNVDFPKEVARFSELPVYVCNDDTAACVAELIFGNPGNYEDYLYLFISSFIGGGLVLDHKMIAGSRGNVGAVGSMPVPALQAEGSPGIQQLTTTASMIVLEHMLKTAGADASAIWQSTEYWGELGPALDEWIEIVAAALAHTAVCGMALVDVEAVIIDGSLPVPVRKRIVARTLEKVKECDLRGLSPFTIVEGTIGQRAQSIGSASLPLSANFFSAESDLF